MCELPEDKTTQPRMWQCFLDMTPKAELTKVRTDKLDFIKILKTKTTSTE